MEISLKEIFEAVRECIKRYEENESFSVRKIYIDLIKEGEFRNAEGEGILLARIGRSILMLKNIGEVRCMEDLTRSITEAPPKEAYSIEYRRNRPRKKHVRSVRLECDMIESWLNTM